MNARDLVGDIPGDLLAAIERQRRVSARVVVEGVAVLLVLSTWLWWLTGAAAEHHHRTALWVGVGPVILLCGVAIRRRRLRPATPDAFGSVGRLTLWTSIAGLAVFATFAVDRDGVGYGAIVGFGVQVPMLALMARTVTLIARLLEVIRGRVQRRRASPDLAAEWSADRAAWAAANNDWQMGEGPLRRWLEREPQCWLPRTRVVSATSGFDVLVGNDKHRWARRLGPGIERTLDDGRVVRAHPQLERMDGLALLSIDDDVTGARGSAGWFRRRFDWRRHAATVVAAEMARGPTAVVSAIAPSKQPEHALLRHFVLTGGTGGLVPVGSLADQRARIPRLCLRARQSNGHRRPCVHLIPPPPTNAWTGGQALAPSEPPKGLVADLTALLPGLRAESNPLMPVDEGARLWLEEHPDRVVLVTLLPEPPLWIDNEEVTHAELLVQCEPLGLVTVLSLRPASRTRTLQSLAALLQCEEQSVEQTVYVQSVVGGDHWAVPIYTKPKAGRLPVVARGMRVGETIIWWPPQGR